MTASAAQLDSIPPISAAQQAALADAEQAAKRFAFAPKLALFNGVTLLLAAAMSFMLSLFDPTALLTVAVLAGSGFIELKYGRKLRAYDPSAGLWLALNQLALLAAIVIYAVSKLAAAITGRLSLASELAAHPELTSMIGSLDDPAVHDALAAMSDLFRTGLILGYSSLIAGSVVAQGGAAYYYFSRRKLLCDFLARTPTWVVDLMRRSS